MKKVFMVVVIVCLVYGIISICGHLISSIAEVNQQIIDEYKSRPVIIRAYTEKDDYYDKLWRKQWYEQYGVEFDESMIGDELI